MSQEPPFRLDFGDANEVDLVQIVDTPVVIRRLSDFWYLMVVDYGRGARVTWGPRRAQATTLASRTHAERLGLTLNEPFTIEPEDAISMSSPSINAAFLRAIDGGTLGDHARVRLPTWNDRAYLKVRVFPGRSLGPWGMLYDPYGQGGRPPDRLSLLQIDVDAAWEPYAGVRDDRDVD